MEFTKTISVLFFVNTLNNTKGAILAVEDFNAIVWVDLFHRLEKEIGSIIGEYDEDDDYDFGQAVDDMSMRKDAKFKEYEFFWEYVDVL